MKKLILILFTFSLAQVYGQSDYSTLLDSAKTLFKSTSKLNREALSKFDYQKVASLFEQAIALNPNDAEAHYFLGYTYSRINTFDATGMTDMNLELLYKTSAQFEKTIELTPKYKGEIIALDPYSKLTGEWGGMAMSYLYNAKSDSAIWAFKEGKKRGGFGDYILEINKKALDMCSQNAILISLGDNFTIPLWYLQTVENYRTDVAVVDISLLNTTWYPAFLSRNKTVAFDLPPAVLDTVEYIEWQEQKVSIGDFSWVLKPSYYHFLLRGDRVLLSLLKENKFQRDVFFTIYFQDENKLSLKDNIQQLFFVDKLMPLEKSKSSLYDYKKWATTALMLSEKMNQNSSDEWHFLENFRYTILDLMADYLYLNEIQAAQELLNLLDKYTPENKYPYSNVKLQRYLAEIRRMVKN